MDFREATDRLCAKMDHKDVADALGVSVQSIRQARLPASTKAKRGPPKDWPYAVIRLAEREIMRNRKLIEEVRRGATK